MKRGRKPKSVAELELTGSWRAKARKNQPIATGLPVRPDYLTGESAAMFNRLVSELNKLGINIGAIDSDALSRYVELTFLYRKAADFISENGAAIKLKNKAGQTYVKRRPELSFLLSLAPILLNLENQFGLTPSARTSLHIQTPPPANPLDGLMGRQRSNVKLLTDSNNGG